MTGTGESHIYCQHVKDKYGLAASWVNITSISHGNFPSLAPDGGVYKESSIPRADSARGRYQAKKREKDGDGESEDKEGKTVGVSD